jgi:hypothetical protein
MRYATVSQSSVTANGPCARRGRAPRRQACVPLNAHAGAGGQTPRARAAPASAAAGSAPHRGCDVEFDRVLSALLIHHTLKKAEYKEPRGLACAATQSCQEALWDGALGQSGKASSQADRLRPQPARARGPWRTPSRSRTCMHGMASFRSCAAYQACTGMRAAGVARMRPPPAQPSATSGACRKLRCSRRWRHAASARRARSCAAPAHAATRERASWRHG